MQRQILQRDHAKTFSDVVFGVIIGLPMAGFPSVVHELITAPSLSSLTRVVLLASALIFSSFYWLELRRFIDEQKNFNDAINSAREGIEVVSFTMARFAGSLIIVVFAAAILKFAELNLFRSFLIANMLFWTLDFFGNIELKRVYRVHRSYINVVLKDDLDRYSWFNGHLGTSFFYLYASVNAILFFILFVLDHVLNGSERYRLGASLIVFALTLFRHLVWRTRIYDWWRDRTSHKLVTGAEGA
jgi:hypothetical protein